MKKTILSVSLFFISLTFYGQNFTKISTIKLVTLEDHKKAEGDVLQCADFLLKTPVKPETENRLIASQFIIKWMSGTHHMFNFGANASKLTKGSPDLLVMYFTCMTKVALTNPEKKLSDAEMYEQASLLLAKYCADKKNKLKPSKKLKKIIRTFN